MQFNLHGILCYAGVILGGVAVGLHLGVFDGIAASCALYALMNPSRD